VRVVLVLQRLSVYGDLLLRDLLLALRVLKLQRGFFLDFLLDFFRSLFFGARTVLGGALERTLSALDPYLMQIRLERRHHA